LDDGGLELLLDDAECLVDRGASGFGQGQPGTVAPVAGPLVAKAVFGVGRPAGEADPSSKRRNYSVPLPKGVYGTCRSDCDLVMAGAGQDGGGHVKSVGNEAVHPGFD
jgi:hypothetical protein